MKALARPVRHPVQRGVHHVIHHPAQHSPRSAPRCRPRQIPQAVARADLGHHVGAGRKVQALPLPQLPQLASRLHELVLAHVWPERQQAHGIQAQLQVGPAAPRIVEDDERLVLGDRRTVSRPYAAAPVHDDPAPLLRFIVAHALEGLAAGTRQPHCGAGARGRGKGQEGCV